MLTKKYIKSRNVCQVTFELPAEVEAKEAYLVGDFNGWDQTGTPMKKVKGVWKATVDLEPNREYQYRYLVNGSQWHNDMNADRYVPNNIDGDNSVVNTSA
jgi:1,4-alpha-glucan branching enzyme